MRIHPRASKLILLPCVALCAATAALAQEATSTADKSADTVLNEVVITGTLIPDPNVTATSPLTSIGQADIERVGSSNLEDVLQRSPQIYTGGDSRSDFGSGAVTLNLRNLGTNRTLILIDGKRMAATEAQGAADISLLPSSLIRRVDVLTGGESAIYGSDAMTGVVDFILDEVNGIKIDASSSVYQHHNGDDFIRGLQQSAGDSLAPSNVWGGFQGDVSLIAGTKLGDGRGHLQGYIDYRKTDPISPTNYDFSGCGLQATPASVACVGSGFTRSAQFLGVNGTAASYYLDPTTSLLRNYTNADSYNTNVFDALQQGSVRVTSGLMGHFAFTPAADLYGSVLYMHRTALSITTPAIIPGMEYTLSCANPLLTADELSAFCGGATTGQFSTAIARRNAEGGERTYVNDQDTYRAGLGLRGELNSAFHYDTYVQYSTSIRHTKLLNDLSISRVANGLNDCLDNTGATIAGCVPYNIFNAGGVTPAAANYVDASASDRQQTQENLVNATLTGDLTDYGIKAPWAEKGVSMAVGGEYRRESFSQIGDPVYASGDLMSFGRDVPLIGGYNVSAAFTELRIPLLTDKPFVKDLSVDGAYRYSHYNDFGGSSTFSVQASYSLNNSIRFRASHDRAERAPSVEELFANQSIGFGLFSSDGCAGASPTYTLAQCEHTGVTAAQYGHVPGSPGGASYNALVGGNTKLNPEISQTNSAGFVLMPESLPGLSLSVDYFDIKIENVISMPSAQAALNQCALTANSFYCSLIHRAPDTGSLALGRDGYVIATDINAGLLRTNGLDTIAAYHYDFGAPGNLNMELLGTYILKRTQQTAPGDLTTQFDCGGAYGPSCGQPTPHWRHTFTAAWMFRNGLDVTATWRYVGAVKNDGNNLNTGDLVTPFDGHLPAVSYLDMTAGYTIRDGLSVRVGAQNLLDKDPPLFGEFTADYFNSNGNTDLSTYDGLGRLLFAKIQWKL
jgi:outer membrane receptor protein involved in Fe transport